MSKTSSVAKTPSWRSLFSQLRRAQKGDPVHIAGALSRIFGKVYDTAPKGLHGDARGVESFRTLPIEYDNRSHAAWSEATWVRPAVRARFRTLLAQIVACPWTEERGIRDSLGAGYLLVRFAHTATQAAEVADLFLEMLNRKDSLAALTDSGGENERLRSFSVDVFLFPLIELFLRFPEILELTRGGELNEIGERTGHVERFLPLVRAIPKQERDTQYTLERLWVTAYRAISDQEAHRPVQQSHAWRTKVLLRFLDHEQEESLGARGLTFYHQLFVQRWFPRSPLAAEVLKSFSAYLVKYRRELTSASSDMCEAKLMLEMALNRVRRHRSAGRMQGMRDADFALLISNLRIVLREEVDPEYEARVREIHEFAEKTDFL